MVPNTKAAKKGPAEEKKEPLEDFVEGLLSESVSDFKSVSDLKRSSKASVRQEEEIDQIIANARKSA